MPHPPPQAERQGALALVIKPGDEGAALIRLPADQLAAVIMVHDLIGGYFEPIGTPDWIAYVAEDERQFPDGLAANLHADALARALGWHWDHGDYAKGVAVFMGRHGTDEADVPQRVLDLAHVAGVLT